MFIKFSFLLQICRMKLLLASLELTTTLLNSGCLAEKRVLALLENLAVKETHSAFFRLLTDQGFTLTFKAGLLGIRDIFSCGSGSNSGSDSFLHLFYGAASVGYL
jgi:hypothetical protein